jgi:general secretion pathway protein E
MRDLHFMPRTQFDAVVSRIKLIAGLDIAERRLPQDGRLSTRAGGVAVDLRVSVIPGVKGESVVIRFLPTSANRVRMESLGLALDHFDLFNDWLDEPNGIVLVTGPTGSGKTTTLYAALDRANDGKRKIVTVEDPVEFRMPGITQIQVQPEIGYSFAQALRAVLRHDPDVILIGEIRDRETAAIATQAALTGHLVLATLHTNDALGAIPRLVDMGVEPFLLGATLRGVMAQRLVRRLCIRCAAADPNPVVPDEWGHWVKQHPESASAAQWRKAVGCTACGNTGYRGRLAIYEFVEVTDALKRAISKGEVEGSQRWRERLGTRSLLQDGLLKAAAGVTSVEEDVRVAGQSAEPL